MMRFSILLLVAMSMAGCLRTRAEIDSGQLQQQTQAQQQAAKAPVYTTTELHDQLKQLTARVASVEDQIAALNAAAKPAQPTDNMDQTKQLIDQRFQAYEQELQKIEGEIQALNAEMAAKKAEAAKPIAHGSTFDQGEALFKKKKWKNAIAEYDQYRHKNRHGLHYADATYKMGVCFEELHMRDEAKAFFQEVVTNHAKSVFAKKSAYRLKHMK